MKANELRIGNWIMDRGGKEWQIDHWETMNKVSAKPQTMMCDGFLMETHPYTEYVDYLYPIPLTEEWLLRMGFEKSQEQWYTIKYFTDCELATEQMAITYNLSSNRCAVFDAIEETDIVNILSYPIYTSKKVLFVHQLQNLYFALTNEELTMK
jgi:hypothetical protein